MGLLRHLRWVHDPNYRGFCIRKNSTAIMKAGGLFEQAKRIYTKVFPPINGKPQIQAKIKEQKKSARKELSMYQKGLESISILEEKKGMAHGIMSQCQ